MTDRTAAATRRSGDARSVEAGAAATSGGRACTAAEATPRRMRATRDGGATTFRHARKRPRRQRPAPATQRDSSTTIGSQRRGEQT